MTRVNAALLAGAVTVLLFAGVFGAVGWLLGTTAYWRVVDSRYFVGGIIAFNTIVLLLVAVVLSRRRAKRDEEDERPTPLLRSKRPIGRRES
jgi:membrane protein DedA with SNARE-associated domain